MIIKLFGSALCLACGGAVSSFLGERQRSKLREIAAFMGLFRHLAREIECRRAGIAGALATLPHEVTENCHTERRDYRDMDDFLSACPMRAEGLKEVLSGAVREMGRGSTAEQLRICEETLSALTKLYDASEKRAREKEGISRALCLGASGLCVILLL